MPKGYSPEIVEKIYSVYGHEKVCGVLSLAEVVLEAEYRLKITYGTIGRYWLEKGLRIKTKDEVIWERIEKYHKQGMHPDDISRKVTQEFEPYYGIEICGVRSQLQKHGVIPIKHKRGGPGGGKIPAFRKKTSGIKPLRALNSPYKWTTEDPDAISLSDGIVKTHL